MKRNTIPDSLFVLALFFMFVAGGNRFGPMATLFLGVASILMTALGAAMLSGPDDDEEPVKQD